MQTMLNCGIKLADAHGAIIYTQALLVVCHSSLAPEGLSWLTSILDIGAPIIEHSSPGHKRTWGQIERIANRFQKTSTVLRLHDVLVGWNMKRSKMAAWPNHR